jgi:hypothetical protein
VGACRRTRDLGSLHEVCRSRMPKAAPLPPHTSVINREFGELRAKSWGVAEWDCEISPGSGNLGAESSAPLEEVVNRDGLLT